MCASWQFFVVSLNRNAYSLIGAKNKTCLKFAFMYNMWFYNFLNLVFKLI